jgi:hypothetical protein
VVPQATLTLRPKFGMKMVVEARTAQAAPAAGLPQLAEA